VIILDTNVVSEPMKAGAQRRVRDWLDDQIAETLYLTSISLSELLLGVEVLPDGKRKEGLAAAFGPTFWTAHSAV
jgi:predicted nucleic acid-binding protein